MIATHQRYEGALERQECRYMSERRLHDSMNNLERALVNLERAVQIPKDRELVAEGTIQRFEMTIELFWKTLRRVMQFEGMGARTSRDCLREAFRLSWLHDEQVWLDMLDSRNTTSHEYLDEALADDNYDDIKKVTPIIRQAFDVLRQRYPKQP
jgi:nucleotidyltransferase substrate binding protein (TIGR01987 family)